MPRRIRFRFAADLDLADARRWYADRDGDLSERFAAAVDASLVQIAESPKPYSRAGRGVRSARVKLFPYRIFYLHDDISIDVVALVHDSRNPALWRSGL